MAISPFANKTILTVMLLQGEDDFTVYLTEGGHPKVIHWETS